MSKTQKFLLAISIIPQYLVVKWLSNYPEFIESYYSNGIYQIISKALRFAFGWIPFSVGDIFYTIAGIYLIRWLFLNRKRIVNDTKYWVIDVLTACSFVYFAFYLFWGMNYYRLPVYKSLNLDYEYTTEELIQVTEAFIEKSNLIQETITTNDSVKVTIPYSKKELFERLSNRDSF